MQTDLYSFIQLIQIDKTASSIIDEDEGEESQI